MSNEVDKQLDEILESILLLQGGLHTGRLSVPERDEQLAEAKSALKQLLTQQVSRAEKIRELKEAIYQLKWAKANHKRSHFESDIDVCVAKYGEQLAELKHAGVSTAASPDVKPRKDVA